MFQFKLPECLFNWVKGLTSPHQVHAAVQINEGVVPRASWRILTLSWKYATLIWALFQGAGLVKTEYFKPEMRETQFSVLQSQLSVTSYNGNMLREPAAFISA